MLEVVSLDDAKALVKEAFALFPGISECSAIDVVEHVANVANPEQLGFEIVKLEDAAGRIIANDVIAKEGVPAFDRSMVDGFAVVASDTFGCSDALPALLELAGEVEMGAVPTCTCTPGVCVRIPTGGQVPQGADAVVMLEYCEEYGDGTVGVARPAAPGDSIAFENDDVKPGQVLIAAGTRLLPHHIGTLASLGMTEFDVLAEPAAGAMGDTVASDIPCAKGEGLRVGIISTGDEIVDASQTPVASQMRDVNAPLLAAAVERLGAQIERFPIVPDEYEVLLDTVKRALASCDMVLLSGGSSAGEKDNTARVLSELGRMLFHGIAVKPGKPTMCADVQSKPVFGLPGHPVAAYFMFLELVAPLLCGNERVRTRVQARLSQGIPSNHGREELVAVRLEQHDEGRIAVPVRGKSGLISLLCNADGYVKIGRNQEGAAIGTMVEVELFG